MVRCLGLLGVGLGSGLDGMSALIDTGTGSGNSAGNSDYYFFSKIWNETLCRLLSVSNANSTPVAVGRGTGTGTSVVQLTTGETSTNINNSCSTTSSTSTSNSSSVVSVSNARSTLQHLLTNKLPIKIIVSYTYTAGLLVVPLCKMTEQLLQSTMGTEGGSGSGTCKSEDQ